MKKRPSKKPAVIATIVLLALTIFTFSPIMNPPQCLGDAYTKNQVRLPNCVDGANIGFGMMVLFVLAPLGLAVLYLWTVYFYKKKHAAFFLFWLLELIIIAIGLINFFRQSY